MPSRRSVLAASSTAAATTLAGCSFGSPEGKPASKADRNLVPDEAPLVARTRAEQSECPHGTVVFRAAAYDADPDDIVIWTMVQVIPGRNREACESDWTQGGVDVAHDWSGLRPDAAARVTGAANVEPTDEPTPPYSFQNTNSTRRVSWRIRTRGSAAESSDIYEFRSTLGPIETIEDGVELVAITVDVPVSAGGLFGDSETLSLSRTLTYGDRDE